MDNIVRCLKRMNVSVSKELENFLKDRLERVFIKKGSYFVMAGQVSNKIAFVEKGLLRQYEKIDGREACSAFMFEGQVVLCVDSFCNRIPSAESVQAIEDCELTCLSYADVVYANEHFEEKARLMQAVIVENFVLENRKARRLRTLDAEKRYKDMLKYAPEIAQRVSCTDIASYLGMTLVTLSRLKRDLAGGFSCCN